MNIQKYIHRINSMKFLIVMTEVDNTAPTGYKVSFFDQTL
jgi:hypothetical protein